MEIRGTAALVTGGASGLGEATVRMLVAEGATVTIVDRDDARGHELAGELGAHFVQADVTSEDDIRMACEAAASNGAPLRIAVSCAGIAWVERTLAKDGTPHSLEVFQKIIAVNLVGTFNVLRLAAAQMAGNEPLADNERGLIVNTASVAAFEGQIGQIAYAASKGGVHAMALPAARDLSPLGIRVNTIAPGTFETPMMAMLPEPARDALAAAIPFPRRLGKASEYAQTVKFLAENTMVNAEVIRVDGALRMGPK
jgi:NAD(P)-dependent dehydrogenase (short-subunit alcohol dehydrogenase family)